MYWSSSDNTRYIYQVVNFKVLITKNTIDSFQITVECGVDSDAPPQAESNDLLETQPDSLTSLQDALQDPDLTAEVIEMLRSFTGSAKYVILLK